MMISKYFWDLNEAALRDTKRALKDPTHPQFSQRMITLLSRCDQPKELFSLLPKKTFVAAWPKIRLAWIKQTRNSAQRNWWETIYEQLIEAINDITIKPSGQFSLIFQKIGHIVRTKRTEMNLSQKQLAHQTGLRQPVISKIEEGKKNVTVFTLIRLCKVLGIKSIDVS